MKGAGIEPVSCIRAVYRSRSNRAFPQDRVYVIRARAVILAGNPPVPTTKICTARSIFPYLIHARQTQEH
jgi:hypothetical protein